MSNPKKSPDIGSNRGPALESSPNNEGFKKAAPGIPVNADIYEVSEEEKLKLTSEEMRICSEFRYDVSKILSNADLEGLDVEGIKNSVNELMNILRDKKTGKFPMAIQNYLRGTNSKHLFTKETSNYLVEIQMFKPAYMPAQLQIDAYDKDEKDVYENNSDVNNLEPWLKFKAQAINALKDVRGKENLIEDYDPVQSGGYKNYKLPQSLVDLADKLFQEVKTKNPEIVGEANDLFGVLFGSGQAKFTVNHLISLPSAVNEGFMDVHLAYNKNLGETYLRIVEYYKPSDSR